MILILCSPRTGSSIVSQIFWRHGCWVDKESIQRVNNFGYTSYESAEIKRVSKAQWLDYNKGRKKQFGVPMEPTQKHPDKVSAVVPDDCMFKTAAEMAPLFYQFDPHIVLVRRNEESAVASMAEKQKVRSLPVDKDRIRRIHRRRMAFMETLDGWWVDTDELIAGDFTSIRDAITACGLEYDESLVRKSIDPGKWNFQ